MDITPSTQEKSQSEQLSKEIREKISSNGGSIPFSSYMEMALYHPQHGYYTTREYKIGPKGDFTTAPEISPLFGKTIAKAILPCLQEIQKTTGVRPSILEFGAGTGALAKSVLEELQELEAQVDSYQILDLSGDLVSQQKECLQESPYPVHWLDGLPKKFHGVIIANEVIDAMPVDLVQYHDGSWYDLHVFADEKNFFLQRKSLSTIGFLPESLNATPKTEGYTTEINSNAQHWIKSLYDIIEAGSVLLIDYGFPAHEYYHPQRSQGTLIGHYRHHTIQDPFFYPGICDLTTHVNWTDIAKHAIESGFNLWGYTNQAAYLMDAGLMDLMLTLSNPQNTVEFMQLSNQAQKLLSEAEMGELFKVMLLGKGLDFSEGELPGFRGRPRSL